MMRRTPTAMARVVKMSWSSTKSATASARACSSTWHLASSLPSPMTSTYMALPSIVSWLAAALPLTFFRVSNVSRNSPFATLIGRSNRRTLALK